MSQVDQVNADGARHQNLGGHLAANSQPEGPHFAQLEVVIEEADDTESEGGRHGDPHIAVGEVSPQKGGEHRRQNDQQAPHGRCAFFCVVGLRPLGSDVLPYLKIPQLSDQP